MTQQLDPFYQDTPIPVSTPAWYAEPANPMAEHPWGMADPTRYYIGNPGGRFPGDLWYYSELLRMTGLFDPLKEVQAGRAEPKPMPKLPQGVQKAMKILLALYTAGAGNLAMKGIKYLVDKYGAYTLPTNPERGPQYVYSGPGQEYGPVGGFAGGLMDRGRDTTKGGIYGFSDREKPEPKPKKKKKGGGGGGFSGLPGWQGYAPNVNFLGWQPERSLKKKAKYEKVDAWTEPKKAKKKKKKDEADVYAEVAADYAPGGDKGYYEELAQEMGFTPAETDEFLEMLAQMAETGGLLERDFTTGTWHVPEVGQRPSFGLAENFEGTEAIWGPHWEGVFDYRKVDPEFLSKYGNVEYAGTDIGGDILSGRHRGVEWSLPISPWDQYQWEPSLMTETRYDLMDPAIRQDMEESGALEDQYNAEMLGLYLNGIRPGDPRWLSFPEWKDQKGYGGDLFEALAGIDLTQMEEPPGPPPPTPGMINFLSQPRTDNLLSMLTSGYYGGFNMDKPSIREQVAAGQPWTPLKY